MKGSIASKSVLAALVVVALGCSGAQVSDDRIAKSEFHYKLARNYYTDRNLAMTQREIHEALQLNPNNAEALHLKGFVLMGLNDLSGASVALRQALVAKPDLQEARNNLGTVLIAQEQYAEAIEILKPLLEDALYPTPAFAQGNVGWAYYKLGDLSTARRHLETAVFLNPRFCLGFNNLGLVHRDQKNPRAAREAFEKAIKVCPKYAEPFYHLGVLLQESGDLNGAASAFATCEELATDSALGKRCAARR